MPQVVKNPDQPNSSKNVGYLSAPDQGLMFLED
jgi:hypothetical protein